MEDTRIKKRIAVIGAGASGVFCAINIDSEKYKIDIFEKSVEILKKVEISGGGRCNFTNKYISLKKFLAHYPRKDKKLESIIRKFTPIDTINWFESNGIKSNMEEDGRVFPISNSSSTIIDCFKNKIKKNNINIYTNNNITNFEISNNQEIIINENKFDFLIIALGSPKIQFLDFLKNKFDINYISPIPSIFTFKIKSNLNQLSGISSICNIKLLNTDFESTGIVLITHFGLSGPAVLKLSAFAARYLNQQNYNCKIKIQWIELSNDNKLNELFENFKKENKKMISSLNPFNISKRLWEYLLIKSNIDVLKKWDNISKKDIDKLKNTLLNDIYELDGKYTNKDEFVTAGGIDLNELDENMMFKKIKNVFAIGEITDIDGVTGGYNFQNAWSSAICVANTLNKII